MSLKIDRVQLEIVVGNDKARLKLQELDQEIKKNTISLNKLGRQNKQNTTEYKELEAATQQLRLEQDKLINGIGLNSLSMKELSHRARELKAILGNLDPGTKAYKDLDAQLNTVQNRMKDLRGNAHDTRSAIDKLADGFNRYQGILAGIVLVFASLIYGAGQFISSMSEMSDIIAGVSKNTGLSIEEVKKLKDEFKDFDTRTANKELLEISNQAGKLGIQGAAEIKGFVKEANVAVVAFGKDLGASAEDTINTLGRVIGAYRLDKDLGWEDSMRRVGAVLNELGKSGTAKESNIVDYVSRLSAAGVALKVSYQDVAGIGATLDGLNVKAESGATAVQKFMFTLVNKSADMSKFLGISLSSYKKMVETDLTGTMMAVLRTASAGNTGLQTMLQQMDSMDVSGERMTSTVLSMVNNVDKLEAQLKIANNEWEVGTSTLNEYNIANETFGARVEKANKEIVALVFGLQGRLEPALLAVIEGTASAARWVQKNSDTILIWVKVIGVAVTGILSYNAAVKLSEMWTKRAAAATLLKKVADEASLLALRLHMAVTALYSAAQALLTGNIKKATLAIRTFGVVMAASPIGLAVAAIGALTAAYFAFRDSADEATKAQARAHEGIISNSRNERAEMEMLFAAINMNKEGTKERSDAINKLNETYGKYLPNLVKEEDSLAQLNKLQEAAIKNIEKKMDYQIRESDLMAKKNAIYALDAEKLKSINALEKLKNMQKAGAKGANILTPGGMSGADNSFYDDIAYTEARILELNERLRVAVDEKNKLFLELGTYTDITHDNEDRSAIEKNIKKLLVLLSDLEKQKAKSKDGSGEWKKLSTEIDATKKKIAELKKMLKTTTDETTDKTTAEQIKSLNELMALWKQLEKQKEKATPGSAAWKKTMDEIEKTKKSVSEYLVLMYPDTSEIDAVFEEVAKSLKKDPIKKEVKLEVIPLEDEKTDLETDYLIGKYEKTLLGRQALNEVMYNTDLISYAEYLDTKQALDDEAATVQLDKAKAVWQGVQNFMQAYSGYNNARMEQELTAAGKNETKQAAIKRKYAKRQQTMDILTAGVNQAVGITDIWAKWAANPIMAGILTSIELAATGMQIAAIKSRQFAKGRYSVVGQDDNRTYNNVPYIGAAKTGIVRAPSLVSERGSEGIVDHKTLYSNVRDALGMTPMDHFRAIAAIRYDRAVVPQFADGRYSGATDFSPGTQTPGVQYASREDLAALMGMVGGYMQKVDSWQQTFTVKNDPRSTMEEYEKYKSVENRAKG